jgi:hypothetical protein
MGTVTEEYSWNFENFGVGTNSKIGVETWENLICPITTALKSWRFPASCIKYGPCKQPYDISNKNLVLCGAFSISSKIC